MVSTSFHVCHADDHAHSPFQEQDANTEAQASDHFGSQAYVVLDPVLNDSLQVPEIDDLSPSHPSSSLLDEPLAPNRLQEVLLTHSYGSDWDFANGSPRELSVAVSSDVLVGSTSPASPMHRTMVHSSLTHIQHRQLVPPRRSVNTEYIFGNASN